MAGIKGHQLSTPRTAYEERGQIIRNGDGSHGRQWRHGGGRPGPKKGSRQGPHSNGVQPAALCPVCKMPMSICMGDCISDDEQAQLDYLTRCNSGGFTLNSSGVPHSETRRGRKADQK